MSEPERRRCVTCGRVHAIRRDGKVITWRDPGDGHVYQPEPWMVLVERLEAEAKAAFESGYQAGYSAGSGEYQP